MDDTQPLDTTIAVVTPENIAFDYQLAGPFRRLPAYLIDIVVRWGIILGCLLIFGLIGGLMGTFTSFGGSFMQAIWVVVMFLVSWFYGTTMEAYFNGRTVGKWSCGIRVIDIDGRPVSGRSALLRNLLRVADMAPVAALNHFVDDYPPIFLVTTGMVGLSSMIFTRRLQRLGDLVAGTMVIVDERSWRLPIAKVDDARVPALSSFVPGDYRVSRSMARTLAIYAERRHYLTPPRRREIARHLTDPLIDRFEFRPDIDPDLLLYALYYKTFLAESSVEEPDLGPLRGYSPLARDMNKLPASTIEQSGASPLAETTAPLAQPITAAQPTSAGTIQAGSNIDAPSIPSQQRPGGSV
ncbi:RDD family protein [Planctomycetes bacterium K23_9]|uniref:RDD family protein n=1 Tax=Stieleria marina TaxID=1930275 RepID=A0A517NSW6_9BACT|nr:RDD family protein [Planctomycetes bacterium K23_9]